MKKGVQAFTVRDFFGDRDQCRETYRKIADIGYDSIQLGTPRCMTVQETKDMLDEFGLFNCSTGMNYEKYLDDASVIGGAVANARIFGTKYITVGTLPEENRYTLDGIKRYAHSLNNIAAELKKEGCFLMYHHHALEFYSFGGGLNGMDILTGETDPDGVLFVLDTHWLAAGGVDLTYWIRKMKGRVPIIHFKDYGIEEGAPKIESVCKTFAEIGEGNINWPPVVDACREAGVECVIVEQDHCKRDPFESLKISFKKLVELGV